MIPQALISVSTSTQRVEAGTHSPPPARADRLIFEAKAFALRARRVVENLFHPVPRHERSNGGAAMPVAIAESRSSLWTSESNAEMAYQLGKVQNLRAAARRLDGLFIPSGDVFSFWRQVGRPSARAGFATGRMLREGCIVPSTGGGLCHLSNALYQTALAAGCEIVERHAHSRMVPGSAAALGQDATVAWNYVDLRFRPRVDMELRVELTRDELVVRLLGRTPLRVLEKLRPPSHAEHPASAANDCLSCGQTACRDNRRATAIVSAPGSSARTAYLLDENWPEFQRYVLKTRAAKDALFIPLDGAHWGLPRYTWPVRGLDDVHEAVWPTLVRAWRSRQLAAQGAAWQLALLDGAEALAESYGRRIPVPASHIVVAQALLPFLWRDGHLGGRTFSVLMTRLPIRSLERRLDEAAALHPQRASLKDFRAPRWVAEAEAEALAAASEIVTPHTAIAAEFGTRSRLLDWIGPRPVLAPAQTPPAFVIGFAGPVAARRGAYEVREAARQLGCRVIYSGADLEGPGFWRDVAVERAGPGWQWLTRISVLTSPAIVESRPSAALAALHAGVPVVATRACGLPSAAGLTLINEPLRLTETLHSPPCRT